MKQNYFPKVDIRGRVRVCLETVTSLNLRNKYIVDVGSSIGWLEKELLRFGPKKLLGIEPDAGAVAYSQKRVKGAKFMQGFASRLPVPNDVADVVVMFDILEHVPKKEESVSLEEANRVLKKYGKLVLSTPNNNFWTIVLDLAWYFGHRHYNEKYLKNLLKKAGFKIDRFEIRGGIWFAIYLIWHYVMKWIFRRPLAVNEFMLDKDDKQFSEKKGIYTIFLIATKV
ncbi:MAG: hypothetical protein UU32_C0001G0014 [Candidatus Woesebacteria bacterium GW2011_GWB1_41_10]|uniref:Methyltransferase type 11 n=1 Tax=Candidatus Woesebacteria bacterium GW2011_GWB1_41_10 TaxID=1618577 RepID=A0A0G0UH77_9BACT|nr:MAG: hypothetical protein UU32_C0001G0014 [Candidatus Woesebacteria bacterium GW2011_GWB1_41_10]